MNGIKFMLAMLKTIYLNDDLPLPTTPVCYTVFCYHDNFAFFLHFATTGFSLWKDSPVVILCDAYKLWKKEKHSLSSDFQPTSLYLAFPFWVCLKTFLVLVHWDISFFQINTLVIFLHKHPHNEDHRMRRKPNLAIIHSSFHGAFVVHHFFFRLHTECISEVKGHRILSFDQNVHGAVQDDRPWVHLKEKTIIKKE